MDRRIPEALSTSRGKPAGVISDVGMTGDCNSVIGMVKDEPLGRFLRRIASGKFEAAVRPATLCAIAVETDDATGLAARVAAVRLGGGLEEARPAFWERVSQFFGIDSIRGDIRPPPNHREVDMLKRDHISFSRRRLLAAASATAAVGLLGRAAPAMAKAPMLNTQAPPFYRFKLGSIEATVVTDGPLSIGDPKNTFRGPTPDELGKMMTDHFLPANNVVLDQNVLVINTGDKLAVFETGMSSVKRTPLMGRLAANLKLAGIDPTDIDAVIPTHAHVDHIGGIMAEDGSRNYPNAQIHISQLDLEFWTDEKRMGAPGEDSSLAAKKNLLPNRERIVLYKDGQEVLPGVQAMHMPGHTVGHTCFVINSGGKSLFLTGDLMHHVILIENPRMQVAFDTDPKQGVETRIKAMDMLASQRMATLVYHLPWPGLGHFAKRGDGFHFEPEPMQMVQ